MKKLRKKILNKILDFSWEEEKKIIYCSKCNIDSLHRTNNSPMNENIWKCLECGRVRVEYKYD